MPRPHLAWRVPSAQAELRSQIRERDEEVESLQAQLQHGIVASGVEAEKVHAELLAKLHQQVCGPAQGHTHTQTLRRCYMPSSLPSNLHRCAGAPSAVQRTVGASPLVSGVGGSACMSKPA